MKPNIFISINALPTDDELFFGPFVTEGSKHERVDIIHRFDSATFTMADMAVVAGFFPSKTQARKNGWPTDLVEPGFGNKKFGKHHHVWWLNADNLENLDV